MKGTILALGVAVATLGFTNTAAADPYGRGRYGGPSWGNSFNRGYPGGYGNNHRYYGGYNRGYSPGYRSGYYTPYRAVPSYGYGYPAYGRPAYGYGYPSSAFSFGVLGPNGGGFNFSLVR